MGAVLTFTINRPDCIVATVTDAAAGHADSTAFTAVQIRVEKRYGDQALCAPEITHSSNQHTPQQAAAFAVCLAYAAAVAPSLAGLARAARIAEYPARRAAISEAWLEACRAGDHKREAWGSEALTALDAQQAADTAAGA